MIDKINFILINIGFPLILSTYYSIKTKKQQINYEITKGVWYLVYGGVVAVDYLFSEQTRYIAGFTVTLAIMEGIPLLLKRIFNNDMKF